MKHLELETENLIEKDGDDDTVDLSESNALLKSTMFDDLRVAFFEARIAAPLIVLLAIFLGYHMTVAPYKTHSIDRATPEALNDLKYVRPVLSSYEQLNIQAITLRAETYFKLPAPSHDTIALRWHANVNKYGTVRPPTLFFEGVTFGVSSENSHKVIYTGDRSAALSAELKKDLLALEPTYLLNRSANCNLTDWVETGFAAYFSFSDLKDSGRLSSDKLQPWKRIAEDVMRVARSYRQVYITVWYPKEFGKNTPENPHKFKNIVQQTLPTRTGLHDLSSTAVVWMSRINNTEIIPQPRMYKQDWTDEELMQFLINEEKDLYDATGGSMGSP